MTSKLIEQATVSVVWTGMTIGGHLSCGRPGAPDDGSWTIKIEKYEEQGWGFGVWAELDVVPAVVPADGSRYICKTLGQARDRAGRLATVLRGSRHEFDWRKELGVGEQKA